jgi:hypothetical protein
VRDVGAVLVDAFGALLDNPNTGGPGGGAKLLDDAKGEAPAA